MGVRGLEMWVGVPTRRSPAGHRPDHEPTKSGMMRAPQRYMQRGAQECGWPSGRASSSWASRRGCHQHRVADAATSVGRLVALKELAPELVAQQGVLAHLRREAQVLARLDDPNCVAVYQLPQVRPGGRLDHGRSASSKPILWPVRRRGDGRRRRCRCRACRGRKPESHRELAGDAPDTDGGTQLDKFRDFAVHVRVRRARSGRRLGRRRRRRTGLCRGSRGQGWLGGARAPRGVGHRREWAVRGAQSTVGAAQVRRTYHWSLKMPVANEAAPDRCIVQGVNPGGPVHTTPHP